MKLVTFVVLLTAIDSAFAISGIYHNGRDQTILERRITKREIRHFEREMRGLLGLPKKPNIPRNITHHLQTSAPKFLYEIYQSLTGSSDLPTDFNIQKHDIKSVNESDTIITLTAKNDKVHPVRHEIGRRLWFNLSDISASDTIVGAELRLYKIFNEKIDDDGSAITVTIDQVIVNLNGDKELIHISSQNITNNYEGWLVFNASTAFAYWQAFPRQNKGIFISIHKQDNANHNIHPLDVGLVSEVNEMINNQPFMVAFLKRSNHLRPRKRRDVSDIAIKSYDEQYSSSSSNPFSTVSDSYTYDQDGCTMQTMYVSFSELNWQEWIIAPDGYAAFYCSGACEFPLNAHLNATNHAIVQTLVNLLDYNDAPKACCAPTKLAPIFVLYYPDENNVILKKYKNMIVKSCGCL